ncbi:MAG TPA: cyclic nucleotide-binding domain-containing protein [Actinomycetota bacterium]
MTPSRRPTTYLLARVPLFSNLSGAQLRRVASLAEQRLYRQGHEVVKAGGSGQSFFVILNGRVKIMKGRTVEAELGIGEFFGELALLDGGTRSRSVVATTPVEAIRIDRPSFRRLLRTQPDLALAMLEGMARRTRKIMDAPGM